MADVGWGAAMVGMWIASALRAGLALTRDRSGGGKQGPAFLTADPAQQHRASRAQLCAETENRNARAGREVIDFAAASVRTEQEFRDLGGTAQKIVSEFVFSPCGLLCHACHPSAGWLARPATFPLASAKRLLLSTLKRYWRVNRDALETTIITDGYGGCVFL